MLTIYKASAGSGKTYTLTRQYLGILLGEEGRNRHREILAITFTNKATEEMKQRIIGQLDLLRQLPAKPELKTMIKHIMEDTGCSQEVLCRRAATALEDLLNDYSQFNVSTIDSFFQSVLRSLAYELDYAGDYEVVLDSKRVTAEGVALLLDDFNYLPRTDKTHTQLGRLLKSVMKRQIRNGKGFNAFARNQGFFAQLVRAASPMFDEGYRLVAPEFETWLFGEGNLERFERLLGLMSARFKASSRARAQQMLDTLNQYGLGKGKANATNVLGLLDKLINGGKLDFKTQGARRAALGMEEGEMFTSKGLEALQKLAQHQADALCRSLADTLQYLAQTDVNIKLVDDLRRETVTYSMLAYLTRYIERFRRDNNVLVLADTNSLLQTLIGDEDQVPFVYEKMGVRLTHFLIDEFQDTSRMQWKNLKPLVDNGLALGGNSLIIGDEKQSIYRFRNSDRTLLGQTVPAQYRGNAVMRGHHGDDNTNWRSAPLVVRFNNMMFTGLQEFYEADGYENVVQNIANEDTMPGYIHFFNAPYGATKEKDKDEGPTPEANPEEDAAAPKLTRAEKRQQHIQLMISQIQRQHEHGYPYSKIAVLASKNIECAEVAEALMRAGIPVATDETLAVSRSHAVKSILSVLRLMVATPQDGSEQPTRSGQMEIDALIARCDSLLNDMRTQAKNEDEIDFSQALLRALNGESGKPLSAGSATVKPSNLVSLVEWIIDRRIPAEQRVSEMAYITAFQDEVLDFTQNNGHGVVNFLRHWERRQHKLYLPTPEGLDAVRFMTVHKSKGLEVECVHIPFASWEFTSNKADYKWLPVTEPRLLRMGFPPALHINLNANSGHLLSPLRDQKIYSVAESVSDNLNKTYVGFTRAVNELCVYYEKIERKSSDEKPTKKPKTPEALAREEDMKRVTVSAPVNLGEALPIVAAKLTNAANSELMVNIAAGLDDDGNIELGTPTPYVPEKKKDNEAPTIQAILPRFYPITMEGPARKIVTLRTEPLMADDILSDDLYDMDDDDENPNAEADKPSFRHELDKAGRRGERIHYALSRINSTASAPRVLAKLQRLRMITADDAAAITQFLDNPAIKPYAARWFNRANMSRSEITVYDPSADKENRTHRIDRIVWTDNPSRPGTKRIELIDFKCTTTAQSEHRTQVKAYISELNKIYPNTPIKTYLAYIDLQKIQEV